MKTMTVLVALQFIAVIILLFKLSSVESEISSSMIASIPPNQIVTENAVSKPPVYGDEEQLRKVIREELASALHSLPVARPSPVPEVSPDTRDNERQDEVDHQYQLELVQNQLDNYVSQGTISEGKMADLQMQIAKLDESGRRMMLGELTRMLNSGDLKGHL